MVDSDWARFITQGATYATSTSPVRHHCRMTSTPPRVAVVPRLASSGDLADRQRAALRLIAEAEAENKNLAPGHPGGPDEVGAHNKNLGR